MRDLARGEASRKRKLNLERLEERAMLAVLAGDYNADNRVDARDYAVYRESFGQSISLPGETVTLGQVTVEDLEVWKSNFGASQPIATARVLENLDRGVVAVRTGTSEAFISWRLLADDAEGVAFNVYRSQNGGSSWIKRNGAALSQGTNYTDSGVNLSLFDTMYRVVPVLDGVEQSPSNAFTISAGSPTGQFYSIPLRDIGDYAIRHMTLADLNGDGKFDYVFGRKPTTNVVNEVAIDPTIIEAYLHDGTFLWSVDLGPGSYDVDNIEPGPSAIDVGNWDGIAAADFDLDGKAEVLIRTAHGVQFHDGSTVDYPDNTDVQFISAIDGMTGAERARIQVAPDYLSDGPVGGMFVVGYLDGERPSLVAKFKNRIGSGEFNEMIIAYDFNGDLVEKWKWNRPAGPGYNGPFPDGHNMRVADVDQDGQDEVVEVGFVLESDGTVKYSLAPTVVHGDRFHIGDFDPARPGLEGYAVQQNNPSLLVEYFYDAATGEILYEGYSGGVTDNGRGDVADIDPNHAGAEFWSFYGLHNVNDSDHTLVENDQPWPHLSIQWDGDLLSEELSTDHAVIDQWNYASSNPSLGRVTTLWNQGAGATTADGFPLWFGDMIGDWREEVIYEKSTRDGLVIFTTSIPTSERLYSLAQNPLYRNDMTTKGYLQSRHTDYFLGHGMSDPPAPNITALDFTGNAAPTVAVAATPSTANTTGASIDLAVLGDDDGGESSLTYTWAALGPAAVSYSATGTNAAKNTTATFNAAGEYTFVVTIRDAAGQTTTSRTSVTVEQVLSGIEVSPSVAGVNPNATFQFSASATDQYGNTLVTQPNFAWSVLAGGGSINSAGLYTAPSVLGTATVQASAGGFTDTSSVSITNDAVPLAWWKLDESNGTVVSDSSGNGLHGSSIGPQWTNGQLGNALSFDGSDYVDLPTGLVDTDLGSVSLWLKTDANFSTYAHVFYASPASGGDGIGPENEIYLAFLSNEHMSFFIKGASNVSLASPTTLADNAWHHVAATWDINGNAVLYVDGQQVGSTTHNADSYVGSSVTRLGRPGGATRFYTGLLDDVRLYSTALTSGQIQAIYNEAGGGGLIAPAEEVSAALLYHSPLRSVSRESSHTSQFVAEPVARNLVANDLLLLNLTLNSFEDPTGNDVAFTHIADGEEVEVSDDRSNLADSVF